MKELAEYLNSDKQSSYQQDKFKEALVEYMTLVFGGHITSEEWLKPMMDIYKEAIAEELESLLPQTKDGTPLPPLNETHYKLYKRLTQLKGQDHD